MRYAEAKKGGYSCPYLHLSMRQNKITTHFSQFCQSVQHVAYCTCALSGWYVCRLIFNECVENVSEKKKKSHDLFLWFSMMQKNKKINCKSQKSTWQRYYKKKKSLAWVYARQCTCVEVAEVMCSECLGVIWGMGCIIFKVNKLIVIQEGEGNVQYR